MRSCGVMKLSLLLLLILNLGCSSSKNADKADQNTSGISIDVKKKVLKNGLTILVVENDKLPIFSYYTYFQVGSKYEFPGITGSSHLLEHMMFKGAKKYGEGEFDKLIEGNGGKNNAYTSNDLTVYFESLPKEHLEVVVDLEADRMQNLLLVKESFEKERNVVLEERKMRYENSDRGKIYLTMMKSVFKGTPYGSSVIGEIDDLKNVSREEVQKYFKQYYSPNNAVILLVGDVNAEKAFEMIEKSYGLIKPTENLTIKKKAQLDKLGYQFKKDFSKKIKLKGTSPTPMFSLALKGIKIGEREGFVLDILSSILGDGESSYLSEKFVNNRKPVLQSIYAANYTLQDSGVFFIGGQLLEKARLATFEKKLRNELHRSCQTAITERAMNKVINQYLVSMLSGLDTNSGIAKFLGDRQVYYGDYNFYKKELALYQSITVDELKLACQKYLMTDESIFISIWNKN
ncbi:MAG: insulinase family protein [Halobacteriovoraceae bacterium]|jgi:zinc protease|nr:insulinase family protein [Halobacteriovoraceae bacterium]